MSNRKTATNPFKGMKKPRVSVVEENPGWGLYAWRKADGKLFMDEDHNLLNIPSRWGDLEKIAQITQAAAHYGEPEGKPEFIPGVQRTTDEDYAEQVERMKAGLLPTMNDFGAVTDAKKAGRERGDRVGE
jgi:hypothetical protein